VSVDARPINAREVARRVLDRVDDDAAWATPALDGELARAGLDERDRRLASELVYGVLRHRSRIDRAISAHAELERTWPKVLTILRVAAYQILLLDRVPGYAAVDDAVEAAKLLDAKLAGFVNAVLRKLTANGESPLEAPANDSMDAHLARFEIEHSTPRWILDELAAATRDEVRASVVAAGGDPKSDAFPKARIVRIGDLAKAFAQPAPIVARVNARRATRDQVRADLETSGVTATPLDSAPMAIRLEGLGDPSRDKAFVAGQWTVQDTGAQLVGLTAAAALTSAPSPSAPHVARVLDACSGVGGKSTHLAELFDDRISIDAADLNATKLALGRETAARLGLASIHTHACDLLDPAAPLGREYDLIVLDAPCTGLGVLRRHPDAKWRLGASDVKRLAELQRMLLDAVVPRLAKGGTLVYSVCTFTRAEGPEQVAALVKRAGLELVEERRTWPPEADAFYLAVLRSRP
jgi:16S rRNA (cytosine967-C5)-methyltransferase